MSQIQCYMCERPAVGREHVPPLCLFPEARDAIPGANLRRQLITVPACAKHNLTKSKDDEYLMLVLPSHYRTNEIARRQMRSKVKRALQKRPGLKRRAYSPQAPALLDGEPTGVFLVDLDRFTRVCDWIVRGIHFHHADSSKLLCDIDVYPLGLDSLEAEAQELHNNLRGSTAALFRDRGRCGANPDVFYYQAAVKRSGDAAVLKLTFYGGFEVMAVWDNPTESFRAT